MESSTTMTPEQALTYLGDNLKKYAKRPDSSAAYIKRQEQAINTLISAHNRQEATQQVLEQLLLLVNYMEAWLPSKETYYLQSVAFLLHVDKNSPDWLAELAVRIPRDYYEADRYGDVDLYTWLHDKEVHNIEQQKMLADKEAQRTGDVRYTNLCILLDKNIEILNVIHNDLVQFMRYGSITNTTGGAV